MLTTSRSDRRDRRDLIISPDYLDDRIVLSTTSAAIGAGVHHAAIVATSHAHAAAQSAAVVHHHGAHMAKHAVKAARVAVHHHFMPRGNVTPVTVSPSVSAPGVGRDRRGRRRQRFDFPCGRDPGQLDVLND